MSLCIKVQNLTKSYRDHVVVRDLSISVAEGEVVVFKGPSGVGKSTFLRCLTYLEPFEKGTVHVGDVSLEASLDPRREKNKIQAVRAQLGFVFQFFNLFGHLSVLENLMIGPVQVRKTAPAEARADALRLLERVGLAEKAAAFPNALSGGQQQRVAIARALAMKPKAILFDEPTSSLDPEMKEEIVRVIADLSRDKLTMLIVTHEPAFLERIATRVVWFGPQCAVLSDERHG